MRHLLLRPSALCVCLSTLEKRMVKKGRRDRDSGESLSFFISVTLSLFSLSLSSVYQFSIFSLSHTLSGSLSSPPSSLSLTW
jgi:hypothetical protein